MDSGKVLRIIHFSVLDIREERNRICKYARILFILEGIMAIETSGGSYELEAEDVIVLNIGESYSFHASSNILFAEIELDDFMLENIYDGVSAVFACNSKAVENENYGKLRDLLKHLILADLMLTGDPVGKFYLHFEFASCYYQVLELLLVAFLKRHTVTETGALGKERRRVREINAYIQKHYRESISLKELSEQLFLSEGYLSRYFKSNYGVTFSTYIKGVRLSHAMDDLLYTEIPITQIAYDNGFSSVSFFNRVFKEQYHKIPSEFRSSGQQQKNGKTVSAAHGKNTGIQKRLDRLLMSARDTMSNRSPDRKIHLSVRENRPYKVSWNEVINIGRASDILKSGIQEHLILLQQALHFRYVRFWNLFSEEMLIRIDGDEHSFNFSMLDRVFDFLISNGLHPFLDLENKPMRINSNIVDRVRFEKEPSEFSSPEKWVALIQRFFRHYLKRYGAAELGTWKVEVFFGGYQLHGLDPVAGYLAILQSTCRIVKNLIPEMEVGGPGFFPGMGKEQDPIAREFWKTIAEAHVPMDFISIMSFPYDVQGGSGHEAEGGYTGISSDPAHLLHDISSLKSILYDVGISGSKLYITEWNLSVSDRNFMNDACYRGAYFIKNIIDTIGEADLIGFMSGSDRISEYYDSGSLLHGGNGLLTKDGIFKPAAFSIELLNRLLPYRIDSGENYIVTTDRKQRYSILCHNLRPLSYTYYMTDEAAIEKDKIERYYESLDPVILEFYCQGIEDGNYQASLYHVSDESGSILKLWGEMGYGEELSREVVKYFRKVCEPKLTMQYLRVENDALTLKVSAGPNEIVLIELERGS